MNPFSRPSDDEIAQFYAIECACGRTHEGERTAQPQQIYCEDCGERLFVLPRSPYPTPKFSKASSEVAHEIVEDDSEPLAGTAETDLFDDDPPLVPLEDKAAPPSPSFVNRPRDPEGFQSDPFEDDPFETFEEKSASNEPEELFETYDETNFSVGEDDDSETYSLAEETPDDPIIFAEAPPKRPIPQPIEKEPEPALPETTEEFDDDIDLGGSLFGDDDGFDEDPFADDDDSEGDALPGRPAAKPLPVERKKPPREEGQQSAGIDTDERPSRIRLYLVSTTILLVVGLLIAFVIFSTGEDNAERIFAEEMLKAEEALDRGELEAAEAALALAVEAADRLELDTDRAQTARQLYREARATNTLLLDGLIPLLIQASETIEADGEEEWQTLFRQRHQDRWVVMAHTFLRDGDDIVINLPIRIGDRAIVWEGDFSSLKSLIPEGEARRLVIGGRWASCETTATRWTVKLEDVFVWRHWSTLEPIDLLTRSEWEGEFAATPDAKPSPTE